MTNPFENVAPWALDSAWVMLAIATHAAFLALTPNVGAGAGPVEPLDAVAVAIIDQEPPEPEPEPEEPQEAPEPEEPEPVKPPPKPKTFKAPKEPPSGARRAARRCARDPGHVRQHRPHQ